MKKRIVSLAVGALLITASMGLTFADEANNKVNTAGNGMRINRQNISAEDLLKQKIGRIEQLVKDNKLSKEEGENYKKIMTERMKDCTTVGENRDQNERLGIGFGKGNGQGKGNGCGMGCGRALENK
ncbi:hypothetical protein IZY60_02350 [Lutibacter sp. B2]|nr:hypothetical protein [Lutibacter sp. B2]